MINYEYLIRKEKKHLNGSHFTDRSHITACRDQMVPAQIELKFIFFYKKKLIQMTQ